MRLILLIRSFLATVGAVVFTSITSSLIIIFSFITGRGRFLDNLMWVWGHVNLFLFNVHVRVLGRENKPQEGCLYLFNHSSHFDILVLATLLKGCRFGAKIELFKIPIFGRAMLALGILPIRRSDRDRVLQLYQDSIARVNKGECFILAAEGTRQPVPGVGARFKGGPFIFAISGQFSIVPVVIRGAAECLPKGDLLACTRKFRHDVTVQILPAVSTVGLKLDDRHRMQEELQKRMDAAYHQM